MRAVQPLQLANLPNGDFYSSYSGVPIFYRRYFDISVYLKVWSVQNMRIDSATSFYFNISIFTLYLQCRLCKIYNFSCVVQY